MPMLSGDLFYVPILSLILFIYIYLSYLYLFFSSRNVADCTDVVLQNFQWIAELEAEPLRAEGLLGAGRPPLAI